MIVKVRLHGSRGHGIRSVTISARGEERVRSGHPWIYRATSPSATPAPGDIVVVRKQRAAADRSARRSTATDREIALRMLTRGDEPADVTLLARAASTTAIRFRESLGIDATAYRLVHGEADLLPSLIVDRYGDYLVVQALSQGVDRLLPELTQLLVETREADGDPGAQRPTRAAARRARAAGRGAARQRPRSDRRSRRARQLSWSIRIAGQKTGLFLDQRENRVAAARYARGRLLDAFSYNGGFALALAPTCTEVIAIDISEEAVARIAMNAARNGLANVAGARHERVRRVARARASRRAVRHHRARPTRVREEQGVGAEGAVRLQRDQPARAQAAEPRRVPGDLQLLLQRQRRRCLPMCVASAAVDAHAEVAVVEKRMQGRDHPVLITVPETYYLKCFILRKLA